MDEKKRWKESLFVPLADHELLEVAGNLSKALVRLDRVDAKRKRVATAYKERITGIKGRIHDLNATLSTGKESRDVEVYEDRDLFAKKVRVVRSDTLELVRERDMLSKELQLEIADAGDNAKVYPMESAQRGGDERVLLNHGDRTEEQAIAETPEEAEELRAIRLAGEDLERTQDERAAPGAQEERADPEAVAAAAATGLGGARLGSNPSEEDPF
jgi:hypothetical protein